MSDSEQGLAKEVERCEYCGKIKPIKYFGDAKTGIQVFSYLDDFLEFMAVLKYTSARNALLI